VVTEPAKEIPYYAGAFGAALLSDFAVASGSDSRARRATRPGPPRARGRP